LNSVTERIKRNTKHRVGCR